MATYKLKGKRYLRKYTAAKDTPVYAAAMDAQAVVDNFCDVPWVESKVGQGTFALHTSDTEESSGLDGYDRNVRDRETLDAALFCAGHKGGVHRAYANAACYVFQLPAMVTYPDLVSLKVKVRCDPYASTGARIALHVSDTDAIPLNCNTVRTGDLHAEGVAPRTVSAVNGTDYWYPAAADCVLAPAENETLALKRYLFVYVGLESYSAVRGNWLEGSAYIEPVVELETSDDLTGWTDGGSEDATPVTEFVVCASLGGESSKDSGYQPLYSAGGASVTPSGYVVSRGEQAATFPEQCWCLDSGTPYAGVQLAYAEVLSGRSLTDDYRGITENTRRRRFAGWLAYAQKATSTSSGANNVGADGDKGWCGVAWQTVLLPIVMSDVFTAKKVRFDWQANASQNWGPIKYNVWLLPGVALTDYSSAFGGSGGGASLAQGDLWTARSEKCGSWLRMVSMDAPDTTVTDPNSVASKSYSVTVPLPFDMPVGVSTLLLTAYADPAAVRAATGAACALLAGTGAGLTNGTAANANGNDYGFYCSDGWKPSITFIG